MPLVNVVVNGRAYTGSIGQASEAMPSGRATPKKGSATCRW